MVAVGAELLKNLCLITTEEECSVKISYEMSFQRGFTHSEDVADVRWKKGGELEVITK